MSETYFRIQSADRDVTDLLDPEHVSYSWDNEDVYDLGTSTCESLEALAEYVAGTGIAFGVGEWVIVEVRGTNLGAGRDKGEYLIQVTEIVSVAPFTDEFCTLINAAYDRLYA